MRSFYPLFYLPLICILLTPACRSLRLRRNRKSFANFLVRLAKMAPEFAVTKRQRQVRGQVTNEVTSQSSCQVTEENLRSGIERIYRESTSLYRLDIPKNQTKMMDETTKTFAYKPQSIFHHGSRICSRRKQREAHIGDVTGRSLCQWRWEINRDEMVRMTVVTEKDDIRRNQESNPRSSEEPGIETEVFHPKPHSGGVWGRSPQLRT